jgi:hypothetical protein
LADEWIEKVIRRLAAAGEVHRRTNRIHTATTIPASFMNDLIALLPDTMHDSERQVDHQIVLLSDKPTAVSKNWQSRVVGIGELMCLEILD